jgi:Uma2 family endonuclease
MAGVVTRSSSLFTQPQWDELTIPESYRYEVVDNELVVMPKVAGTVPPITVEEWEAVCVPENYRAEIIQGELVVSPSPAMPHAIVLSSLFRRVHPLVPADHRLLWGVDWVFPERGVVAEAPEPDLVVVPRDINRVTEPPLWAVEVLSPTDRRRLQKGLTRIEGKHLDYATYGIADYLEVDWAAGQPVVVRYENHNGVLVEVDRAEGDKPLVADRPFPYEVVPARLLD